MDVVVSLFLLVVLAFGTLFLLWQGVNSLSGGGSSAVLLREGSSVISKLDSLVRGACSFDEGALSFSSNLLLVGTSTRDKLDFLADVDGDDSTGGYEYGRHKGLERVLVYQAGAKLKVDVRERPSARPQVLTLTDDLYAGGAPFSASYLDLNIATEKAGDDTGQPSHMPSTTVSGVRIRLIMNLKGTTGSDTRRFVRSVNFGHVVSVRFVINGTEIPVDE